VFDQGLGDLFDIRTAGHVLDGAALGSLEFGVAELKIPLLVVLGHKRCGAVNAAIKAVDTGEEAPGSIQTLVEYIRPSALDAQGTGGQRLASAIYNNTVRTMQNLLASEILSSAVEAGNLMMVGAHYDLDTAVVSIVC
jgi:carbonic anhydrase